MRNECIVLASNVGGISELISDGKTGFLSAPSQLRIQEKIIEIFNLSSSLQDVIRTTALSFIVERYDNDKIYEKHLNVYKEIQSNGN
jgi:glycosyltransferase involved in cell wall biosynthesis